MSQSCDPHLSGSGTKQVEPSGRIEGVRVFCAYCSWNLAPKLGAEWWLCWKGLTSTREVPRRKLLRSDEQTFAGTVGCGSKETPHASGAHVQAGVELTQLSGDELGSEHNDFWRRGNADIQTTCAFVLAELCLLGYNFWLGMIQIV